MQYLLSVNVKGWGEPDNWLISGVANESELADEILNVIGKYYLPGRVINFKLYESDQVDDEPRLSNMREITIPDYVKGSVL